MNHIPTFVTREFHWTGFNDEPKHEPRTFWTCSCGHDNAKSGHAGGYTSEHRAKIGHSLHASRAPKEDS